MKLDDIFIPYSYHQITDEILYSSDGDIPVYTGNKEIKGYWSNTFIDEIDTLLPCIAFPLKGNNSGFSYIVSEHFDANNTGLLVTRTEYKNEVNLEWFKYKLRSILIKIQTNKDGVSFINKEILKNVEFELPNIKLQNKELEYFQRLNKIKEQYEYYRTKCNSIISKSIYFELKLEKKIELNKILSYVSRNDILSEEGLYNIEKISSPSNIIVLSGSIENIYYGEIPIETEKIHHIKNKQCLHIVTRGKAGRLTYLKKGNYATNTNAFLIYIKDDIKKEIGIKTDLDETVFLKFLKIYLEPLFLDISSNSDVSVFPLTKVFTETFIPKFTINKKIKTLVEKYESINKMNDFLSTQIDKIDFLLEKEIKSNNNISI